MALTRFTKIPFNPLTDNNKEVFLSLPPFCFFSRNPQVNFLREIILENLEKEKHGFVRKASKVPLLINPTINDSLKITSSVIGSASTKIYVFTSTSIIWAVTVISSSPLYKKAIVGSQGRP